MQQDTSGVRFITHLPREAFENSLSEDLKLLGKSVVPILLKVYDDHIKNSPLWRDELQEWTKKLLLSLPWDEATHSASRIGLEKTNKPDAGDGK